MIKQFVANRYRSYTPDGKFWLTVGIGVLIVDMAIAYCAGATVTVWHGLGFAGCALAFAYLPDAAYEEFDHGRYISALFMTILCVPIGIQAYQQQLTYSAGMRTGDMQQTKAQNARYTANADGLADARTNYALWTKQLAELQSHAPWAATVKAEALRKDITMLEGRLKDEVEGKRGRKAACGKVCDEIKDQIKDASAKMAAAERMDDLTNRIDATKSMLDKSREAANKTEYKSSVIFNVASINAQLFKVLGGASAEESQKVDEVAMNYANIASAGLGSLALLLLAPIAFFLAGRRRIAGMPQEPFITALMPVREAQKPAPRPVPAPQAQSYIQRVDGMVGMRNPETLEVIARQVKAA